MTKLLQVVLLATALIAALATPAASLLADGGGPWPDPPSGHIVNT
jgi:hypothetical protein